VPVRWVLAAALRADERRFLRVVALDQALMTLPVAGRGGTNAGAGIITPMDGLAAVGA
jgi:hypothetical protein